MADRQFCAIAKTGNAIGGIPADQL